MILCGFEDEVEGVVNNSVPDVELIEGIENDLGNMGSTNPNYAEDMEDKLSNASKNSFAM